MSHLVVELGGARRSLEVGAVQVVVRAAAIARVPAGPPWVRGLAAVRGRLVPVVDPGGATGARGPALLVIVNVGGRGVGLIVDRVEGVIDAAATETSLPPPIELAALGGSQ
jgi:purine-binding chemotaxis protein CheW